MVTLSHQTIICKLLMGKFQGGLRVSKLINYSWIYWNYRHNLRILGLIETDAGMFQCIGTNPAGSIQSAARLEIAMPSEWFVL